MAGSRQRRRPLVLVAVVGVLTAPGGTALAASGPDGPRPQPPGATMSDLDHDHVSDDFAPRLRGAAASERLDVLVSGLSAVRAQQAVGRFVVRDDYTLVRGFAATMTAGQARALARTSGVSRVEADAVMRVSDAATDVDYGAAAARSAFGVTGAGVGICVVDTGVDADHEQIAPRPVTFKDFVNGATTPYDDHGHGTHVMSIAAGDGTGGGDAASHNGVAPGAQLYAAKALDAQGQGADSGIVSAVQWCAGQSGVRVISMSLGGSSPSDGGDLLSQAVNNAVDAGKVVVVAAGNAGDAPQTVPSPGAAAKALTVGAASDHSGAPGSSYGDAGIYLAPFSSRGPTTDGRLKPDVVAPGVTVEAAQAGTTSGYVTYSGTSMATPYVAGAVALGLQAVPTATPPQVLSAMTATAEDWGPAGKDIDWGAGLVDVEAFVSRLRGGTDAGAAFPTHTRLTGSVARNGSTSLPLVVPASGLGTPLAVTVTIDGQAVCTSSFYGYCFTVEWSPDLDLELLDPSGAVVGTSTCVVGDLCGVGRQETVAVRPAVAGTYTLRVYAWTGSPNNGKGGTFAADISQGPLAGTAPPPPVANRAPVADAGADQTVKATKRGTAAFTLDGSRSSDPDGDTLTYRWEQTSPSAGVVGTTATVRLSRGVGTYVFRLTVTDPQGLSATDSVTVTVVRR